jgi:uncharacterized metal-binding protein YceD (DUF177 family)
MNPLTLNLRHLATRDLDLVGSLSSKDLELDALDPLITEVGPVSYALKVEKMERSLLITGTWELQLSCQCSRCLKPFPLGLGSKAVILELELQGEEAVTVDGDFVDLTPHFREDILLAFPQHPLCGPGCRGLESLAPKDNAMQPGDKSAEASSAWAVLDKLKLND